jgi:DNA-binding beta-propeller fold protein YncE
MSSRTPNITLGLLGRLCALALSAGSVAAQSAPTNYHVTRRIVVGGDGAWDYVTVDTARNRVFVTRADRAMAIDPATGKVVGEIRGLDRGHGVAFAYATGHGFVTSGEDSTVTMFDLATLKPLARTVAAIDDDAVLYDPASHEVFTFNGDAGSATVIDPMTGKRVATIALGGKPEFGVSAGDGKLYVNIEDRSQVVEIDAAAHRVTRRWSIASCESPSGLAIDVAHHILFSGCRNKLMAISNATTGKLLATAPIGSGVDANAFDPATQNAFASNGDGTLTVVHEDSPTSFHVVQTVTTMPGARTMALDPRTHTLYTVSARFGPMPAGARGRPPVLPNTFTLIEIKP